MAKISKAGNFWDGEGVKRRAIKACEYGINKTMAEAVLYAKKNHQGWQNRTGTAERSIMIDRPAMDMGSHVSGTWGSFMVKYFIYLEFGTGIMQRAYNTLRLAARAVYPHLRKNIKSGWRRSR